jgi:hypothetical protein
MRLTTRARCISHPPCEWTGTTDRSAERHTKETGHATVSETIPVRGDDAPSGILEGTQSGPGDAVGSAMIPGPGPDPDLAGEDVLT